jgi:hypothetical protein
VLPLYETLLDYERARAWRAPPSLRFSTCEPKVTRDAIVLPGVLANESVVAVEVVVFPAFLALRCTDGALVPRPPAPGGPPRPPPVPPPPLRFDLPPRERVEYEGRLSLADFTFEHGHVAELEWTFTWWTPPCPTGLVRVVLP